MNGVVAKKELNGKIEAIAYFETMAAAARGYRDLWETHGGRHGVQVWLEPDDDREVRPAATGKSPYPYHEDTPAMAALGAGRKGKPCVAVTLCDFGTPGRRHVVTTHVSLDTAFGIQFKNNWDIYGREIGSSTRRGQRLWIELVKL